MAIGRFSHVVSVVLLAGCGGQARSNADARPADPTASDAGSSAIAGSGPTWVGGGASNAGTASADGSAQGGAASVGGNAHAGSPSFGGNAHAGSASFGGKAGASNAEGGRANAAGNAASAASGEGGGDSGTAGAPPAAVTVACSELCAEASTCPEGGGAFGPNCQNDCLHTFPLEDHDCTSVTLDMVSCLTPALRAEHDECVGRFNRAKQTCDVAIRAYQRCARADKTSALCVHLSIANRDGGIANCMEDVNCLNGLINNLRCVQGTSGKSDCSCFTKFSRDDITVDDPTLLVCSKRFDECLATGKLAP